MNNKVILEKLIKIANNQQKAIKKIAQVGVIVRVNFNSPQYFSRFLSDSILNNFRKICHDVNDGIDIEVKHEGMSVIDGGGIFDGKEFEEIAKDICAAIEKSLQLDHGELFDYSHLEHR